MKIKLTPELSYIIGLWRKNKTYEGLGVKGDKNILETFAKEIIEKQLTTSDKILNGEEKIYFYHTAYRRFFQEVEEEQLDRYKYLNEYAGNYLAGLFDGTGTIDERGVVYFNRLNKQDEVLLLRLGFNIRKKGEKFIVERPLAFLAFIRNYVKIFQNHKVFELIKSSKINH